MKKIVIATLVSVIVLALVIVGKSISVYNGIIALDEGVKAQWAQVENTYQRRFDLVPNLVATVQGEADFEKSTLAAVTDARSKMGGTVKVDENMLGDEAAMKRFQEMQAGLGGALQRLMAVSENYPDLKSNTSFQELRVQLEGAENRIATERMRYNEIVKNYNTTIRQFPNSLIAGFAGASPKVPFSADAGASAAPAVKFDTK
ncbi:MAG: LemA family protein [Fibrobacter sp.]|jgi:LemA protein|uniref:LemA family protein n=1 Tax=Fibrobacter sp. UWP2 TaxID=1896216 RepID=UPI00092408C0|nr:LemA family protein [Fibrobacter sp. UWP2]MBO7384681.1 LemA family protein [Fibrobacter sp.]MCR5378440.1 LemA family protein [Fibrobacter sp.]SHI37071.1 LemA protein [Fibrobacter sp. UWP2]